MDNREPKKPEIKRAVINWWYICPYCKQLLLRIGLDCPDCGQPIDWSDQMKCKHCLEIKENEIGEKIAFCELKDRFMNLDEGECFGSCESEDGEQE